MFFLLFLVDDRRIRIRFRCGSVSVINGYGSGRSKNIWILRFRIRNIVYGSMNLFFKKVPPRSSKNDLWSKYLSIWRSHFFSAGLERESRGLRLITLLWMVRIVWVSTRTHATCIQPSTINHQPSTINYQLSAINHQPSTINHQPSTINHQPSTINHQPSTIVV